MNGVEMLSKYHVRERSATIKDILSDKAYY